MPGDSKQFERALNHWDELRVEEAFSAPLYIGRTAIICAYSYRYKDEDGDSKEHGRPYWLENRILRQEALEIADKLLVRRRAVEVMIDATADDIDHVLTEPGISSVITIGHGSLSDLRVKDGKSTSFYDWNRVSETADHLKRGRFVQRQCGIFSRRLSVPLGTFAMMDHRNVLAATGYVFMPKNLGSASNRLVKPVSTVPRLSYEYVLDNFSYGEEDETADV